MTRLHVVGVVTCLTGLSPVKNMWSTDCDFLFWVGGEGLLTTNSEFQGRF